MKKLLVDLLWSQLRALGMLAPGEHSHAALRDRGGLAPMFDGWLRESVRVLECEGYVQRRGDTVLVGEVAAPPLEALWPLWESARAGWLDNPDLRAQMVLLDAALKALPDVLSGKKAATEIIFPNSSVTLVENIYKHNPMADYFNQALADRVAAYVRLRLAQAPGARLRMLEIGAGTGATSAVVLERLNSLGGAIEEYCYTDISKAFLHHAERSYGPRSPFLSYRVLNIEAPVTEQGLDAGSFDVVIAANVLHATRNIRGTMRNTKRLLKKNGVLFLNELTTNSLFNHLTFGLLEGWWRYEDSELRIQGSPGLEPQVWLHVLEQEGYRGVSFPCADAMDLGQQIIMAESDGVLLLPTATGAPPPPAAAPVAQALRQSAGRVENVLMEQLAAALRIDRDRLRTDEPFSSYGLDSILAVTLTRSINQALGTDLEITVMFEHNTVDALRTLIMSVLPESAADSAVEAVPFALARRVVAILAQALRIEPARIDNAEPFSSYGLDSILAVNVTRQLNQEWDIDLDITVMFEHGTVDHLCAFMMSRHGGRLGAAVAPPTMPPAQSQGYAIVGVNGKFPGADDIHAFWDVIEQGRHCIGRPPAERADWRAHAEAAAAVGESGLWGGFINGAHEFDPVFFGIAPAEAAQMSPEQRLLLMCVWNTLEDAGYTPRALSMAPTGVFLAAGPSEYRPGGAGQDLLAMPTPALLPNRISYLLNLHGPSEFCDTTCSSSLVALHRAVQAMRLGECEQAIVGGVNLVQSPRGYAGMAAVGMLSSTGEVRPFQDGAQGTVRSEGVGAILLKPLERAVADGDHIYAVVKGTGVAHGGKGVSLTAPNIRGMKMAMQQAYRQAGVAPATVGYIEAHGMASALADGAEISALKSGLQELAEEYPVAQAGPARQYLSTLKPCIGHAEVASGMAALIKVVQAMGHRTIPGIAGFTGLSSAISLAGSTLAIAAENVAWEPLSEGGKLLPRRASINSYGISGVNAHAVLEEYAGPATAAQAAGPHVIVLSARDEEGLRQRAAALLRFADAAAGLPLADVAYTLQTGREDMAYRFAAVVQSREELVERLASYLDAGAAPQGGWLAGGAAQRSADIVELFSGKAGEMLMRTFAAERQYQDIARHWVKGAAIDWAILHLQQTGRKVPLPGYPFKARPCGEPGPQESAAPAADQAEFLRGLLASVLGLQEAEMDLASPLSSYGLNSLLLIRIMNDMRRSYPGFKTEWLLPHNSMLDVRRHLSGGKVVRLAPSHPELVHLNSANQGRPVFWIHGALGSVETFVPIAARSARPFYAIEARGFADNRAPIEGIEAMAAHYVAVIRSVQPEGPYELGGFCLGGIIAYEMTRQLQQQGQQVHSLAMIDSPDITGMSRSGALGNIPFKNAALQVANTLLWPSGTEDLGDITAALIHQDELDNTLDDEAFVERLAELAAGRGLAMGRERIAAFVARNMKVQVAYRLQNFRIQALPDPAVACYYFRNRRGLFYGELACYFKTAHDPFSLDHVNYWQDWENALGNFNLVDIEASNHMTILSEARATGAIIAVCEQLYSMEKAKSYA